MPIWHRLLHPKLPIKHRLLSVEAGQARGTADRYPQGAEDVGSAHNQPRFATRGGATGRAARWMVCWSCGAHG